MFQRRNPLPIIQRLAQILWPRQGWVRAGTYVAHRLRRLPGTPYRIAAGFASGAAISFTPFIGFHFVLAGLLAMALRANIMAAAIGTAVGNPWTFPFIWAWIYSLGRWMLGSDGFTELPSEDVFSYIVDNPSYIFSNPLKVLVPMVLGSVPTTIAAWILFFLPLRRMVARYQIARRRRIRRKMLRLQRKKAVAAKVPIKPFETQANTPVSVAKGLEAKDQAAMDPGAKDSPAEEPARRASSARK